MDTSDQGSPTTMSKIGSPRRGGTGGVLRLVVWCCVLVLCASLLKSSSSSIDHWMAITTTDFTFAQQQSTIDCNNATAIMSDPPPPMGTNFIPVQCDSLQPPIGDPNGGRSYARTTDTNPSFWVSLHNETFDRTRWAIMIYGYYYEQKEAEAFHIILQERSGRVLDVGGNIGYFTLKSASMGAPRD